MMMDGATRPELRASIRRRSLGSMTARVLSTWSPRSTCRRRRRTYSWNHAAINDPMCPLIIVTPRDRHRRPVMNHPFGVGTTALAGESSTSTSPPMPGRATPTTSSFHGRPKFHAEACEGCPCRFSRRIVATGMSCDEAVIVGLRSHCRHPARLTGPRIRPR